MQTLEKLYEIKHKNQNYFERKQTITSKKTIINGTKKSGKTHLVIDHMSQYASKNILYIDLLDARIDAKAVVSKLAAFLQAHPIEVLVIENFDFSFDIPNIEHIILTCNESYEPLEGFETITLFPLDFEEFIAFDKKHFNVEHLFNLYANIGSYPIASVEGGYEYALKMQEMLRSFFTQTSEFEIFKQLCIAQSTLVSPFAIFKKLSPHMKLSKDKFYEIINKLQENNMIFLLEKFHSPKSKKKVFIIDFALRNSLTLQKEFLKNFENMVFLELIKKKQTLFYTQGIDFYNPTQHKAILCIPFLTEDFIKMKLKKILDHLKELDVRRVEIISVGNEGAFYMQAIQCNIIPFWDWALRD